jgi:hypothetical protein
MATITIKTPLALSLLEPNIRPEKKVQFPLGDLQSGTKYDWPYFALS